MPRITLYEQPNYEFQFNTTVQASDLNYANHLGNDTIIGMIQDARANIFFDLGFSELDLGDSETGIIIADLVVNFKAEGFMFDELRIDSHIGEVKDKSFRIFHRIIRFKDKKLIALAETGLVVFNYKHRKITDIPEAFAKKL